MHIFVVFATTVQAALSRSLAAAPGSPLHPAWASLGVVQQTAAKGGAWLPRSTHPATHPRIDRTAPGELLLGVVVETGEKLHLLGTGAMVDGIVEDEHVDAIRLSQGSEQWMSLMLFYLPRR